MKNKEIKNLTKLCLLLGSSLLVITNAAIVPSLVEINNVFNDQFGVSLMMSFPAIAVIVSSLFIPSIINKFGDKNTLLLGLGLSGLAGSSGLWINSLSVLLISRFLLGIGVAMCIVVINDLIASYFDGEERMHFISHQAIAVNASGIFTILGSGWLATLHWRLPFAVYLLPIFILLLSLKGIVPINKVNHSGVKRIKLRNYKFVMPLYFLGLFGMLSYYLILIDLPFTLKSALNFNSARIGAFMGGMSLISAVIAYLFKFVVAQLGEQRTLALCFSCFTVAFCSLSLFDLSWGIYVVIVSMGIAFGLLLPILTHLVIIYSNKRHRTSMMSGFLMFYFAGQALSAFVHNAHVFMSLSDLYLGFAVVCIVIVIFHLKTQRKLDIVKKKGLKA